MSAVSEQLITPRAASSPTPPGVGASRPAPGSLPVAFAALWLFTLLLYVRPNEVFPGVFGQFPFIKIVAVFALLAYFLGRHARGEALTVWTVELRMVLLIWGLGAALMPIAASPGDSWAMLTDVYLKVVCIFFLLVNLLDTRERLRSILKLVVTWSAVLALDAIYSYASGQFQYANNEHRIKGMVSGIFGNPNDLAIGLVLVLPIAVALALNNQGWQRGFYCACAALLGMGVMATFSRGGFLGLLSAGAILLWKIGRRKRLSAVLAVALAGGAFVMLMPSEYGNRLSTILATDKDKTGSAQEREELLRRAATVAAAHPIVGVGIGNFHIYSIKEKLAHNAYLEIAAELGLVGLLAYLTLILVPLLSMLRVERETGDALRALAAPAAELRARLREGHNVSIALQASLVAYIVCTLFGSVQYQWFLYYVAAYAVAMRRIHEMEAVDAPTGETGDFAGPAAPEPLRAKPRTRLGRLAQAANGTLNGV